MNAEIILIIILIILNAANIFFGSFFKTKGKNLATSQDISDLTKKVELVKQEFAEKDATLRSKLDLLTNLQLNLKNDERVACISFHKAMTSWVSLCTEAGPSLTDAFNNQEIRMKIRDYDEAYSKVKDEQAVLELYIADEELFELISVFIRAVLTNLAPHPMEYLYSISKNNLNIESLDTTDDTYNNKYDALLKERKDLHDKYGENMLNGLNDVINDQKKYINHLRNHIKELSAE